MASGRPGATRRFRPGDPRAIIRGREGPLRNALRLVVGIAVSGLCFWVATRGVDWAQVRSALGGAHLFWVLMGFAGGAFAFLLRAIRWCVLLRPVQPVPVGTAFSATAIGFAATAVLPFRLGEIVRPALLGQRTGMGMSPALSSVVVERILDMLLVVSCALLLSTVWAVPDWLRQGSMILTVLAFTAFFGLMLAQRWRGLTDRLVELVLGRLPARASTPLRSIVDGLLRGVSGLGDGRTMVELLGLSVVLWAANALPFAFALLALDVPVPLVGASLASLVIVAAAVFLPQAPGFVGTWQVGCTTALGLFAVTPERAVAFSLLTWVMQLVTSVGLGGVCLAREDLSMSEVLQRQVAARTEGPA